MTTATVSASPKTEESSGTTGPTGRKQGRRVTGWQRDGRLVCRGSKGDRYIGWHRDGMLTCTCWKFVNKGICPHIALYAEYIEGRGNRGNSAGQRELWAETYGDGHRKAIRRLRQAQTEARGITLEGLFTD